MRNIDKSQVLRRIRSENPWWDPPHQIEDFYREMTPRAYFEMFFPLVKDTSVRRAVLLMGPRRVGKTVLIHQAIGRLIAGGVPPTAIGYVSVDHPLYNGLGLEELLDHAREANGVDPAEPFFIFFDEIQYLREWEVHLKTLVDSHRNVKAIASGSAAAALRRKSRESGAGRFTDFLLPPLTFYEYLELLGQGSVVSLMGGKLKVGNLKAFNQQFIDYMNFGGYPEVIFSEQIKSDPGRFIRSDVIDKVLLRDLPSLYGIQDIQELNSLFTMLAYNTGNEVSLDGLSQNAGIAKNTIKRYIEYLEAAFLIKTIHRVDYSAKRFKRANFFKVYLANPCMRSALFSQVDSNDESMGHLVETAIFSQLFHQDVSRLHYARWKDGEVDLVQLSEKDLAPNWVVEIKWSDAYEADPRKLSSLLRFCKRNGIPQAIVTTLSADSTKVIDGIKLRFAPASVICYINGYDILRSKQMSNWPFSDFET